MERILDATAFPTWLGTYTVRVQPQPGWPGPTTPSGGSYSVTIGSKIEDSSVFNQGFAFNYDTISGRAWDDFNANGIQDSAEPGLQGVKVELIDRSGNPVTVDGRIVSIQTGASGSYRIRAAPGSYKLKFSKDGYSFSPKDVGGDDSKDSDVDSSGRSDAIDTPVGSTYAYDAGLYGPWTVNGAVFKDLNKNKARDGDEPGLSGWIVRLDSSDGTKDLSTTATDGNGVYLFRLLPDVTYRVSEEIQHGWAISMPSRGYYEIPADKNHLIGQDFGNLDPALVTSNLSDRVWNDADGDGQEDDVKSEPGLSEWVIELTKEEGIVNTTRTGLQRHIQVRGNCSGEDTFCPRSFKMTGSRPFLRARTIQSLCLMITWPT